MGKRKASSQFMGGGRVLKTEIEAIKAVHLSPLCLLFPVSTYDCPDRDRMLFNEWCSLVVPRLRCLDWATDIWMWSCCNISRGMHILDKTVNDDTFHLSHLSRPACSQELFRKQTAIRHFFSLGNWIIETVKQVRSTLSLFYVCIPQLYLLSCMCIPPLYLLRYFYIPYLYLLRYI